MRVAKTVADGGDYAANLFAFALAQVTNRHFELGR